MIFAWTQKEHIVLSWPTQSTYRSGKGQMPRTPCISRFLATRVCAHSYHSPAREREKEREREREREREGGREANRQTKRQTDRDRERRHTKSLLLTDAHAIVLRSQTTLAV
eukprot:COSAG02_NODE_2393_length_8966_cov_3.095974_4_plen_111_part_00